MANSTPVLNGVHEIAIDVDEAMRKKMDYDRRRSLGYVTRYSFKRKFAKK